MKLNDAQQGVLRGMLMGAACALVIVLLGAWLDPFSLGADMQTMDRMGIAIASSIAPALFLAVSIGRLAKHRFFSPQDIDGGLTSGTDRARLLQSLLQNTLEQTVLASMAYAAWAIVMPATWLSVVPLAAVAFGVGRILFIVGYRRGAAARAFGFALSFYTTLMMLAGVLGMLVVDGVTWLIRFT